MTYFWPFNAFIQRRGSWIVRFRNESVGGDMQERSGRPDLNLGNPGIWGVTQLHPSDDFNLKFVWIFVSFVIVNL